jgi:hypothetical protein
LRGAQLRRRNTGSRASDRSVTAVSYLDELDRFVAAALDEYVSVRTDAPIVARMGSLGEAAVGGMSHRRR